MGPRLFIILCSFFGINSLFFFKFFLVFILPYSLNVSKIFPWFQVLFHDYTFAVAHKCLGGQVNSHRFCHSSQKHIMACNGIVIRLHPLWHFTSAWLLTSAKKIGVVLPWVRWVLPWIVVELQSCREFSLSCCKFCFCRDSYGPPYTFDYRYHTVASYYLSN